MKCPKCGNSLVQVKRKVYRGKKEQSIGSLTDYICTNQQCPLSLIIVENVPGKGLKNCKFCGSAFHWNSAKKLFCTDLCRKMYHHYGSQHLRINRSDNTIELVSP
ncbi:MAG: hypothetical protein ACTSRU_20295 [Candidatus Hodarchaeales archaeon]